MLVGVVVKVSVGVAVGVLVSVATTGLAFHEDEVMFLGGVVTWMLVGVLAWLNFELQPKVDALPALEECLPEPDVGEFGVEDSLQSNWYRGTKE
jgi:hypothetical protein